jgi:cytochrome c biogenesis protein
VLQAPQPQEKKRFRPGGRIDEVPDMTTLTRQSQQRPVKRKGGPARSQRALRPPPLRSRVRQRALYWLRHPLNASWAWLSAVRTAIFLISAIVVVSFLGIYFQQAPGEVLNDPAAYAGWVQLNELPRYGSLTPIFDWLQFYTIFSSWYFLLLLTLLACSIIVCTLNRLPAIWQNVRHPLLKRSDKFYDSALERLTLEREDAGDWTARELRRRGYRVRTLQDEGTADEVLPVRYLYANKNSWATLSTFVFHAALVTLLLGGMLSQWHGFPLTSPARSILPAPLVNLSDSLAGFTFDQALPDGSSATVYPRGTPHNISFRANHFLATFDPHTGLASDYVTDLSVYQDGVLVAHSTHLRVNDPLAYNGIIFHQSSFISAVNVTISDSSGCLVCRQAIVLNQTETAENLQIDLARDIPIANTGFTLSVFFPHAPHLPLVRIAHPMMILVLDQAGEGIAKENTLRLFPGQSGVAGQNWHVTLNGVSESTVLLVTRDSGSALIWPAAVLLILSLCITFYFPQRRIWVKVVGRRAQLAALREHFVNMRPDLLALVKASRSDHSA